MFGSASVFAAEHPQEPAQRVVALAPHLAELVCAAGGCEQLVGRVSYSDYPPQVEQLPLVGDAFAVNLEALVALQPDLVLSWDGGTGAAIAEQLRRVGLRVEPVAVEQLDDIGAGLRKIGQWLGIQASAETAAEQYEAGLSDLRQRYAQSSSIRVFYQIERQPMFSISQRSPIGQAIALCGGDNIFADLSAIASPVNAEAVIARAPEVIVFSDHEDERAIHQWWTRFRQVPAVKADALIAVPADLLARATPRMLQGVEALCDALDHARHNRS